MRVQTSHVDLLPLAKYMHLQQLKLRGHHLSDLAHALVHPNLYTLRELTFDKCSDSNSGPVVQNLRWRAILTHCNQVPA